MPTEEIRERIKKRYFLGGKEVNGINSAIAEDGGWKSIRCPDGQPGIPLCYFTDYLKEKNGELDIEDPVLKEILDAVNLLIEKTFIVQIYYPKDYGNLQQPAGEVYGYW